MIGEPLSNCTIFLILLWKNWRIHLQNRVPLMYALLSPALFGLIFVVIRMMVSVKKDPSSTYESINLTRAWNQLILDISYRKEEIEEQVDSFEYNVFVPRPIVGYAPNIYQAFENIMNTASTYLYNTEIIGFANCIELRERMTSEYYLAGVCFDDRMLQNAQETESKHLIGIYPNNLKYALIFPSELRMYHDTYIGYSWETNSLYDLNDYCRQRNINDNDGGYVGYAREGFLSLQNAVSMAYIRLITKKDNLSEIVMQRFPHGPLDYDAITDYMNVVLPMLILAALTYPIIYFSKFQVLEKEWKVKTLMRFMGFSDFIAFMASFFPAFLFLCIPSIILVVFVKVHWHAGHGIYTHSSWTAVLFILLIFNISALCFSFMVFAFFSDTTTAIVVFSSLWFLSFSPFMIASSFRSLPMELALSCCCFSNTAMGFALSYILQFEGVANGFHWHNFFDFAAIDSTLSVGSCTIMLVVMSVVYVLIGLLARVEIVIQACNFCSMKRKTLDRIQITEPPTNGSIMRMSKVFEVKKESRQCTVELREVTKEYDGVAAVENISLELYENEIAVLMGHNGAGKTTIADLILGITHPTSGKVIRYGYDLSEVPVKVRHCIGFQLRGFALFHDLSVEDQLTFFSLMKGSTKEKAAEETQKFLLAMELLPQKHVITKDLSLGKRNLLAVCCALAGDSKTVVLDQPNIGMDLANRRLLWDILFSERNGRTIFIVSVPCEEVEYYADRVTIIEKGHLKCNGSIKFLKKIYGNGYRLICAKSRYCETDVVTQVIQKYIPNIEPECDLGTELSYLFDSEYVDPIIKLLSELEEKSILLGLEDCRIREVTLSDIFIRMGAENASDGERKRHTEIMNGASPFRGEYANREWNFLAKYDRLEGFGLWWRQWHAMFRKHILYFLRNKTLAVLQILLPIILVSTAYGMRRSNVERNALGPLLFEMDQYPDTTVVLAMRGNLTTLEQQIGARYRRLVFWFGMGYTLQETYNEPVVEFMIRQKRSGKTSNIRKYIFGATIAKGYIIAWFSNYPLHTAPLSLNTAHRAMLRSLLDDDNTLIEVSISPLPYSTQHNAKFQRTSLNLGFFVTNSLTLGLCFLWTINVIYLVKENESRYKLLQFISGVHIPTFWSSKFIFDMIIIAIMCALIMLTVVAMHYAGVFSINISIWFFIIKMAAGVSIVSSNYLMSMFFQNDVIAYAAIAVISLFGICFYCVIAAVLRHGYTIAIVFSNTMLWLLHFFPYFSLQSATTKASIFIDIDSMCNDKSTRLISIVLEQCNVEPNCCVKFDVWSWDHGIMTELYSFAGISVVSWIGLFFMEYRKIFHSKKYTSNTSKASIKSLFDDHERRHNAPADFTADNDAIYERIKLETLRPSEFKKGAIIFDHVGMLSNKGTSIPGLCLIVKRAEYFGFIGRNGSGKSSLLRMLVGDQEISFGDTYIGGIRCNENFYQTYKRIGYCPQNYSLLDDFKVCEVMELSCALRGIPANRAEDICVTLGKMLGFDAYYQKTLLYCPTGIKKRVSWANAILSNPSILILDDPNMAVDAGGSRQLFRIISTMLNRGTTILMSSLCPRECERDCDRVAIISRGRILCIGNPFKLNDRYMLGYILKIKLKPIFARSVDMQKRLSVNPFLDAQTFIETEFPSSVLKDQRGSILIYLLRLETMSMSKIFKKIQENAFALNIDEFNIARANLAAVYEELMENHNNWLGSKSLNIFA